MDSSVFNRQRTTMPLTERGLLHLEDLGDDGLLLRRLGPRLDVPDDERDLHDVVHRRHEQVGQLQLLAPRVPVAPLQCTFIKTKST